MNIINILGVNISKENNSEILKKIHSFLVDNKPHYVVTPNPEIILKTAKDEELFYILNNADISLADGMGLKIAGFFMGKNVKRFTGSDLTSYLLKHAEENNYKIVILNWRGGLSQSGDIEKILKQKFPKLKFQIQDIDRKGELTDYQKINNFSPDILFSTLGSPWQEKNIYHSKDKIKNLKLALAVGGSFDFITGKKIRSPRIFQFLGFEWLWRLLIQPNRIGRIFNATFVFIWKFLIWRFLHPLMYRPNVACLLYKKEGNSFKILMVRRKEKENHWQIPQEGTDRETLELAGEREMREKLGTDKFRKIKTYKNLHKYKFPPHYNSKYNTPANLVEGYKGQKQGLYIAEFLGNDNDIIINFWEHTEWKWVKIGDAFKTVHHMRRESLKIYLKKLKENI